MNHYATSFVSVRSSNDFSTARRTSKAHDRRRREHFGEYEENRRRHEGEVASALPFCIHITHPRVDNERLSLHNDRTPLYHK